MVMLAMASHGQSPPSNPSTSTPEYVTFRKCYQIIVRHMKQQPGAFCDAIFARSYISPLVRDYTRNDYIGDEAKAQKMVDTLVDQIEHDPSVYHGFIKITEDLGTWAETLVTTMKKCYEAECKPQPAQAIDKQRNEHSIDSAKKSHLIASGHHPVETSFPFLDVSTLSEDEKAELEIKLSLDTKNIIMQFSQFTVAIRESLERNKVPLDKIKDSILSLHGLTHNIGVKVLDSEDKKEIKSAQTEARIFLTLQEYISFLNPEIIMLIVQQCGSPDDQKKLEDYLKELDTFCKRSVFEVPQNVYSCSRPAAKKFVIKCTEHQLTLEGLQVIKQRVAEVFRLPSLALQLSSIRAGCVEVHFLISATVADYIFPVSHAQLLALGEFGVKLLTCQEEAKSYSNRLQSMDQTDPTALLRDEALNTQGGTESSRIKWRETKMTKYGAEGDHGVTLLIVPKLSTGSSDPQVQAIPRRTQTKPLSEEERVMLEEQGVPRDCQDDDITITKVKYEKSRHNPLSMQSESAKDVRQQIVRVMKDKNNTGVVLYYIGPGKKGTGDWCFSDGFITFRDLMKLYVQHFKRRVLTIVSDCSYSGSWVREAMAFMDEQGVGPCGHVAKEKGILIKVAASCLANEIPTELAFSTHGLRWTTGGIGVLMGIIELNHDQVQHTSTINFTGIRCKHDRIDQPCTMAPGSTWHQWSIQKRVFRYNGITNGRLAWYYLLAEDDDETIWKFRNKTQGENAGRSGAINIKDYGQILRSGWGWEPTFEANLWITKNLFIDYEYHPLSD